MNAANLSNWFALPESALVEAWWQLLTGLSAFNLLLWCLVAGLSLRRPDLRARRWPQACLSAGYTLGCAFRAVLPRADVQRICLVDSWLSSVALGRSVATVAELCFAAQLALYMRELGKRGHGRAAMSPAQLVLPLLVLAELFSWYAVLTTDYLGNTLEQSLWTATGALVTWSMLACAAQVRGPRRALLIVLGMIGAGFVAFMTSVDLPMYWTRWQHALHEAAPRLHWLDGLEDASTRWLVTFRWEDWYEEIPWMTLYFSVAVWVSIALVAPLPEAGAELSADRVPTRRGEREHGLARQGPSGTEPCRDPRRLLR